MLRVRVRIYNTQGTSINVLNKIRSLFLRCVIATTSEYDDGTRTTMLSVSCFQFRYIVCACDSSPALTLTSAWVV